LVVTALNHALGRRLPPAAPAALFIEFDLILSLKAETNGCKLLFGNKQSVKPTSDNWQDFICSIDHDGMTPTA
jgi:hypothetical protein